MKRQNKGQIRIIEAFLAVLIILSSFAVSSSLTITQNVRKSGDLASTGLQALITLDSDGSLGRFIDNRNWTAVRGTLDTVLPVGVCFNLTVYDDQMNQINDADISNGALSGQEVASVEYVCTSQNAIFHCYMVRLQLAVVE
jgi:hypothetical protein